MLVPTKVQLAKDDLKLMEEICNVFNYKSKSEYMRLAILEKIKTDVKKLRHQKRENAIKTYGEAIENCFESIDGEDFETR
jgi:hypothetical protein